MHHTNSDNKSGVITSGDHLSYWISSSPSIDYETLAQDIQSEILIIGGGIAGLSVAYCLAKAGKKIVLVEDGQIGSGESGRTTAHLTYALDDRYYDIEKVFGEDDSKKAAESHSAAIDWIEKVVSEEKINCHFKRVDGYLFCHPSDKLENLEKEYKAILRTGLPVKWLEQVPGISSQFGPCIQFPEQAQFHIMEYLNGLANAIVRMGGKIYTNTHAKNINKHGAEVHEFKISAEHIVVATNTPVNDMVTMHTKQIPFRTYVIGAAIPKGSIEPALWWDTGDMKSEWFSAPYHYVRTQTLDDQNDLLIVGGEDHKTGQADKEDVPEEQRYQALIAWTKKHFPLVKDIRYKWSGQVLEPLDYMAYIGKNPGDDNIYIVTGDSGNGMTHGTLGGLIISDMILGNENPWTDLYSPKRIPLKEAGTFISQQLNVLAQYGDYVTNPISRM